MTQSRLDGPTPNIEVSKGLMFKDTKTWNPATGCDHFCPYCWFFNKMLPKLSHTPKYANGGKPTVHWELVHKGPPNCPEKNIFVVDMGDLFCGGFRTGDIIEVLDSCHKTTLVKSFMLLTKNPARYLEILSRRPDFAMDHRFVFGATIETTNHRSGIFKEQLAPNAPDPSYRADAMIELRQKFQEIRTFLSLEPIMDFDLIQMRDWVEKIRPERTYVGYDNYHYLSRHVEPELEKVNRLIHALQGMTEVIQKTIREKR